jgi:hypothetical protein
MPADTMVNRCWHCDGDSDPLSSGRTRLGSGVEASLVRSDGPQSHTDAIEKPEQRLSDAAHRGKAAFNQRGICWLVPRSNAPFNVSLKTGMEVSGHGCPAEWLLG